MPLQVPPFLDIPEEWSESKRRQEEFDRGHSVSDNCKNIDNAIRLEIWVTISFSLSHQICWWGRKSIYYLRSLSLDLFEEGYVTNMFISIVGNVFGFKALRGKKINILFT